MNSCDCVSMSNSDKGNNAPSGGPLDIESNHTNGDRLRLVVRLQVAPYLLHGKSALRADEGQKHVGGRVEQGIREHVLGDRARHHLAGILCVRHGWWWT